jgi:hypothetical protein
MGFTLGYNFKCSPSSFDDVDFFEFLWMFERLGKQKDQENKDRQSNPSGTSLETLMR